MILVLKIAFKINSTKKYSKNHTNLNCIKQNDDFMTHINSITSKQTNKQITRNSI